MRFTVRSLMAAGISAFLACFFMTLPARGESVEERIEALRAQIAELKGEQAELKKETTAARDMLPSFVYRPGRGLTIRGADRSWQIGIAGTFDTRTSFFPDNDAKAVDDSDGPSQFAMKLRRLRIGFDFEWEDGLYSAGFTPVWERSPSAGFLGGGMSIDFSKFSPYYPRFDIISVRPMMNRQGSLFSSSGGTSQERPMIEDSIISSGSTEGYGFFWRDVPLGPGRIRNFDIVATKGQQFDSKTSVPPLDKAGVAIGFRYQPFSTLKGSLLQGLELGVGFLHDPVDDVAGSRSHVIDTTTRTNSVEIFRVDARGKRNWVIPNVGWNQGPLRLGFSWDYIKSERDFTNVGAGDLDDMVLREITARAGLFIWGPKGFLSGDERGGVMIAYNYFRPDFDSGRDFDTRCRDFCGMRRWHVTQHAPMIKWFQKPNLIYSIQYNVYDFNKFKGDDLAESRQRLGIGSNGGTSQDITLAIRYDF